MSKEHHSSTTMQNKNIVIKSIEQVMHESMMPYSEFVIMDRAIPRVEDGLKPVQRRVLYSMYELGNLPDRAYKKSAKTVGDCMGKYHPHGDSSIYDTMVRLAQDFNMREVLVDGHGNFGSIDGDSAAAMRYTEARLSPISLELLRDIDKDTVDWSFTFDDQDKEPDMLPGRFPNLLVNGCMGIAVGLATNIPTHNLRESIDACVAYINNEKISDDELLAIMPGPDFPTGAYILNSSEIKHAYTTGKGRIIMRAKHHIESGDNGKKNIIFTEIPFQVNKATLLQKIQKVKETDETGNMAFVQDVIEESDRSGMRIAIRLKKDANIKAILAILYKGTDLQCAFNVNMVAIADNKPKLLTLREIISYYVKYQQKVVLRRTKFDLDACEKKAHILEGLLIAINNIDDVIKIIRGSKSTQESKRTLMATFYLSEAQAQAILDMRLAKLTSIEVNKLIFDLEKLKMLIKQYQAIIKSPTLQMQLVKDEMLKIKEEYGNPRRTQFIDEEHEEIEEVIQANTLVNDVCVVVSAENTIKSMLLKSYNLATKELSANPNKYEIGKHILQTTTDKTIYLFTNLGNSHSLQVDSIELGKYRDKGFKPATLIRKFDEKEKIVGLLELNENDADSQLLFVTKEGMVKTTSVQEYLVKTQSIGAIKLKEGDELIYVGILANGKRIALWSASGMAVAVDHKEFSPTSRMSQGVRGMALAEEDELIGAIQFSKETLMVAVSADGYVKQVRGSDIPLLPRNRKGLSFTLSKSGKAKVLLVAEVGKDSYVVIDNEQNLNQFYIKDVKLCTRTQLGQNFKGQKSEIKLKEAYPFRNL